MPSPHTPPQIFDRRLWRLRRARARFSDVAFLRERVMADIVDRLEATTRRFPKAVFYGAGDMTNMLTSACGVDRILHGDITPAALCKSGPSYQFVSDEELSPLAPESADLIVSFLTLHAANDLIGALAQARAALKPDGLFLAAMFGENTLSGLRKALYAAETTIKGGVTPRVAPFASVRDLGGALQRAGFAMPVADIDTLHVDYRSPYRLFTDLRAMGETSILAAQDKKQALLSRSLLIETLHQLDNVNNAIQFDIVFLTGWAPSATQPRPLKPGSAKHSLAEAVNAPYRDTE